MSALLDVVSSTLKVMAAAAEGSPRLQPLVKALNDAEFVSDEFNAFSEEHPVEAAVAVLAATVAVVYLLPEETVLAGAALIADSAPMLNVAAEIADYGELFNLSETAAQAIANQAVAIASNVASATIIGGSLELGFSTLLTKSESIMDALGVTPLFTSNIVGDGEVLPITPLDINGGNGAAFISQDGLGNTNQALLSFSPSMSADLGNLSLNYNGYDIGTLSSGSWSIVNADSDSTTVNLQALAHQAATTLIFDSLTNTANLSGIDGGVGNLDLGSVSNLQVSSTTANTSIIAGSDSLNANSDGSYSVTLSNGLNSRDAILN